MMTASFTLWFPMVPEKITPSWHPLHQMQVISDLFRPMPSHSSNKHIHGLRGLIYLNSKTTGHRSQESIRNLILTRQHKQGKLLRNSSMIGMIFLPYLMMRWAWDQNQYKGHGQVDHHPTVLDSILITNIPYTVIIQKRRLVTVGVQLPASAIVT